MDAIQALSLSHQRGVLSDMMAARKSRPHSLCRSAASASLGIAALPESQYSQFRSEYHVMSVRWCAVLIGETVREICMTEVVNRKALRRLPQ